MNLIEAFKSGKRWRRKDLGWKWYNPVALKEFHPVCGEDIIADDYEIEQTPERVEFIYDRTQDDKWPMNEEAYRKLDGKLWHAVFTEVQIPPSPGVLQDSRSSQPSLF